MRGLLGVGAVSCEEAVVLRMILHRIEKGLHGVPVEAIDFRLSPPLEVDELASFQRSEIMGHHALLLAQGVRELGHTHVRFAKCLQYGKPGRVSQGGEKTVAEIGQPPLHQSTP